MPGFTVDGMNVFDVYEAASHAVARARAGEGPTMLECRTYRYYGHTVFDNPLSYRTAEEEEHWRGRDPLKVFRETVIPQGEITAEELDAIDAEVGSLMEEAVQFADQSPAARTPRTLRRRLRRIPGGHDAPRRKYAGVGSNYTKTIPSPVGRVRVGVNPSPPNHQQQERAMTTATATRELQVREAINEAIRQEMERDETVIIMGEEIAGGAGREHLGIVDAWGGPFRTTVGLIQQFGNQRVLDTPLSEAAFVRHRHRRGLHRNAGHRRADVRRLHRRLHGPDAQQRRQGCAICSAGRSRFPS